MLIPVVMWYKAWVCGRSMAGIVGSNPARAWMFVSVACPMSVIMKSYTGRP